MKTMLKAIQKKNSGISGDIVSVFEDIVQKNIEQFGPNLTGVNCFAPEWDDEFSIALKERLSDEQRFRLYEQNGGCNGTGYDKARKEFAFKYADMPLRERLALFCEVFGRKAVLNDDSTITVTFACTHGYYKRAREGKYHSPPPSVEFYFERCAGGRLYEYQKALGVKLKIKSVDISPLHENVSNPVVFEFEVVQ